MAKRRLSRPTPRPKLTRPQRAIYDAGWTPGARFRTAVCGRRFGKTFLVPEEIRRAARLAVQRNIPTDNEIWYAAPNFKQAKRVFWRRLKKSIPSAWLASKPNETDCSIVLASGHVIRLVGLDNYDALRGSGLWFVVVDEWADCPYAAWTETLFPMLSAMQGHALMIGTPKGFDHLRDGYIAGQPGAVYEDGTPITDQKSFCYTTIQGGNVPAEEIATARRNLDPRTFRQEYEASFETFAGRVIYAYSRAENARECPVDWRTLPLKCGIDFNILPMSCVTWVTHGGLDYIVDEIILETSNTDELVAEMKRRYGPHANITCYPDPAGSQRRTSAGGRTDITILRDARFNVVDLGSHPKVRDRINETNARFQSADGTRRTHVSRACPKTRDAFEKLTYKQGTDDPDKTLGFDHIVDAYGYSVWGAYKYKPPQATRVNLMGR